MLEFTRCAGVVVYMSFIKVAFEVTDMFVNGIFIASVLLFLLIITRQLNAQWCYQVPSYKTVKHS